MPAAFWYTSPFFATLASHRAVTDVRFFPPDKADIRLNGRPSGFDPGRVETFFVSQKLHATGRHGPRRDRLSLFLLYRVWSQPGRNLGAALSEMNGHKARTT